MHCYREAELVFLSNKDISSLQESKKLKFVLENLRKALYTRSFRVKNVN